MALSAHWPNNRLTVVDVCPTAGASASHVAGGATTPGCCDGLVGQRIGVVLHGARSALAGGGWRSVMARFHRSAPALNPPAHSSGIPMAKAAMVRSPPGCPESSGTPCPPRRLTSGTIAWRRKGAGGLRWVLAHRRTKAEDDHKATNTQPKKPCTVSPNQAPSVSSRNPRLRCRKNRVCAQVVNAVTIMAARNDNMAAWPRPGAPSTADCQTIEVADHIARIRQRKPSSGSPAAHPASGAQHVGGCSPENQPRLEFICPQTTPADRNQHKLQRCAGAQ